MSEGKVWKVSTGGNQEGPFTAEEVRDGLASGRFSSGAYVWMPGWPDWKPIREIFPGGVVPPPPPPPRVHTEQLRLNPEAVPQIKKNKRGIFACAGCFGLLVVLSLMISLIKGCSGDDEAEIADADVATSEAQVATAMQETKVATGLLDRLGSEKLQVSIGTIPSQTSWMPDALTQTIRNATASKSGGTLTLKFDIDLETPDMRAGYMSPWQNLTYAAPLLVRLFDENGQYLTHFTSAEGFMANEAHYNPQREVYERAAGYNADLREPQLLKARNNVMHFNVNQRDLRDAKVIEVGFTNP